MSKGTRRWLWALSVAALPALALIGAGTSSAEQPDLSFEVNCTPDTFRPGVWVAVECSSYVTNHGAETLRGQTETAAEDGPIPDYYFIQVKRDEEVEPVPPGRLVADAAISPGETIVTETLLLLKLQEGTFRARISIRAGDAVIDRFVEFEGDPDATAPTQAVDVTQRLEENVDGPAGHASYETTITNNTTEPLTDVSIIQRTDEWFVASLVEPVATLEQQGGAYLRWDLHDFGKESLGAGESLTVRTRHENAPDSGCGSIRAAVVVQADIEGERRLFAAGPDESAVLGDCGYYDDGEGAPTAFGRGGDGPLPSSGGATAIVVALASLGLTLATGGSALRRCAAREKA